MTLQQKDYQQAAESLDCDVAAIKAVASVETSRDGLDPDGFPTTLFEGHSFYRLTNGKYAADHPTLCYPNWTKQFYGSTWQAEKARLQQAVALDRDAALKSASWGMFQIMGFNHGKCGFSTVQEFVNAMCAGEGAQLQAFVSFVRSVGLADALRDRNWTAFAHGYNGPDYAANQYDKRLEVAYSMANSLAVN